MTNNPSSSSDQAPQLDANAEAAAESTAYQWRMLANHIDIGPMSGIQQSRDRNRVVNNIAEVIDATRGGVNDLKILKRQITDRFDRSMTESRPLKVNLAGTQKGFRQAQSMLDAFYAFAGDREMIPMINANIAGLTAGEREMFNERFIDGPASTREIWLVTELLHRHGEVILKDLDLDKPQYTSDDCWKIIENGMRLDGFRGENLQKTLDELKKSVGKIPEGANKFVEEKKKNRDEFWKKVNPFTWDPSWKRPISYPAGIVKAGWNYIAKPAWENKGSVTAGAVLGSLAWWPVLTIPGAIAGPLFYKWMDKTFFKNEEKSTTK